MQAVRTAHGLSFDEQLTAGWIQQAQEHLRERRLAATRFTHEAEDFATVHLERDTVDGVQRSLAAKRTGADLECLVDVPRFEDYVASYWHSRAW